MAFHGKTWPIGLAPGMGINAFVAYGVVAGMGYTPQAALGAVLVAGIIFLAISLTPIRAWLINSIPRSLKLGIGAPIPSLRLLGIELISQALIGVREIAKKIIPATRTAPKAA